MALLCAYVRAVESPATVDQRDRRPHTLRAGMADAAPPRKKRRPVPSAGVAPIVPAGAVARLMHMGAATHASLPCRRRISPRGGATGLTIAPLSVVAGADRDVKGVNEEAAHLVAKGVVRVPAPTASAKQLPSPTFRLLTPRNPRRSYFWSTSWTRPTRSACTTAARASNTMTSVRPARGQLPCRAIPHTAAPGLTNGACSHGSRDERPL